MKNAVYSIQIDLVDTEHSEWIQNLCNTFRDYVEFSLSQENAYYKDGCTLTLNSTDYPVMKQLAEYICTKVSCITHIENCVYFSFGFKYWISYCKRIIDLICSDISNSIKTPFIKYKDKKIEQRRLKID